MLKTVSKFIRLIFLLFLGAGAYHAYGQVYPVQVTTQIVPPYTPYLSDYTAPGSQRMMMNFVLRDPTLPEYRCKLRITIEGVGITIRTKASYVPEALVLPGGGVPTLLYGEDLLEYFKPDNLDFAGITRNQYEKGAKLPEGIYRFTVEVLDYNRNTVVSNKGTATAWVILNDPPLLNLPRKDTKVQILDPTNIPFTWTPRHTGSPNAAFTTEYVFRLVEVWPVTRNPYDAFLSQPVLYEVTSNVPQIIYDMAAPALLPGRKYAWQVQARDVEGRDLFKNDGRSEVYVFQFGDALGIPEALTLQSSTSSALTVRWDQPAAGSDAVTYRTRYRPHNNRTHDDWYEGTTNDQWKTLSSLQPNTEYEVQVRAEQTMQTSDYSATGVFKTAEAGASDFACKSDVQPPPTPANTTPTFPLNVNDTIHAGGYDVLVRGLTASGKTYTGEGFAMVPWLHGAKVRVTFKDIAVNSQFWLTSGEIKSVWNADSKFLINVPSKDNPANTPNTGDLPVTVVATDSVVKIKDAAIATVTKDPDGNIVVSTTDGNTTVLEKGKSYSIVDDIGNGYVVDKEGNITKTTAEQALAAAERGNRDYNIALHFEASDNTRFGFDAKKYEPLNSFYQQLNEGDYIAWKAVTSSEADEVNAVVTGDLELSKLKFEIGGVPLALGNGTSKTIPLSVRGKAEGSVDELLATYPSGDTTKPEVVGKLNLISYDKISKNVVIVPVNGVGLPDGVTASSIQTTLNTIYRQAVTEWKVSQAAPVNPGIPDNTFDDGEPGLLSNYTGDMKAVINAYPGKFQDNTYYLFLVNNPKSGKTALGYMPRSKQAGFIFVSSHEGSENDIAHTIGHELGHGAFNLQHTFDEFSSLSKSGTDNLMDYPNGPGLLKYQWDHIHDPQRVISLFEDDDESSSTLSIAFTDIELPEDVQTGGADATCESTKFQALNNKIIDLANLKADIKDYTFSNGRLFSFVWKDGKTYKYATTVSLKNIPKGKSGVVKKISGQTDPTEISYVCFDCLKADNFPGEDVEQVSSESLTKTYTNIPDKYKLKPKNEVECAIGVSVVSQYDATSGVFTCKPLTQGDCERQSGAGQGAGGGTVFNFTKADLDYDILKKLFSGTDVRIDKNGDQHHTLKAILFVTDNQSYFPKKPFIESYKVPEGYIKIWIHDGGTEGWSIRSELPSYVQNILDNGASELGLSCPDKDSKGKSVYKMSDFNSPLKAAFSSLDMIATAYYELFDALSSGIRKARVPEYVWNCNSDKYQPVYAYVYRFITLPLSPLKNTLLLIGGEQLAKAVEADNPELAKTLRSLSNGQAEFAFVCGVWNGLIETIASVADIGKIFYGAVSCQGRSDFSKFWGHLKQFEKEADDGSLECYGAWCAIKTGFAKQFSGTCQISEMGGEIAFVVIVSLIDPAACESLLGKGVATALKVVQYCDQFADKFNPLNWALRVGSKGIKVVKRATNSAFGRFFEGKFIAMSIDGKRIEALMSNVKLEEDVDGGLLAKVMENGEEKSYKLADETIKVVDVLEESLEKSRKEFMDYMKAMGKQFNSLPFLDPKFIKLFGEYAGVYIGKGVRDFTVFVSKLPADIRQVVENHIDDAKAYFARLLGETVQLPAGLLSKLSRSQADHVATWVNGRTLRFKANNAVLEGVAAKNAMLAKLETALQNERILEVFTDSEGRLLVTCEGAKRNTVYGVVNTRSGEHVVYNFAPAYKPSSNPNINVPLSEGRLVPDYANTNYMFDVGNTGKLNSVRIKMTGKRKTNAGDFYAANEAAGFVDEWGAKAPSAVIDGETVQYVWHHMDDMTVDANGDIWCTMQLVESGVHTGVEGMAHSGSVAQYRAYTGIAYTD